MIVRSGYECEEHNVFTPDGYLLVMHRVIKPGQPATGRPVLMMHGCMMSSEVWVCLRSAKHCLPFVLVEAGYDVWLGNVRGNKYCQKHITLKPSSLEFWDFSLEETIQYDVPCMIDYVLGCCPAFEKLVYIGFSQGTTQGFAALSLIDHLNDKVSLLIGLSATTKPKGMTNRLVKALTKTSPELLFLFFGRKIFIRSVSFWRNVMSPVMFTRSIDWCQHQLFGWDGMHIRPHDKIIAYQHLYAFTSSKLIVHWFQIMRSHRLQMFDEGSPVQFGDGHVVPQYRLKAIRTPIALFIGGRDSLVDNEYTKRHLDHCTIHVEELEDYEHLDFLWAHNVDTKIYPHILHLLEHNI